MYMFTLYSQLSLFTDTLRIEKKKKLSHEKGWLKVRYNISKSHASIDRSFDYFIVKKEIKKAKNFTYFTFTLYRKACIPP